MDIFLSSRSPEERFRPGSSGVLPPAPVPVVRPPLPPAGRSLLGQGGGAQGGKEGHGRGGHLAGEGEIQIDGLIYVCHFLS